MTSMPRTELISYALLPFSLHFSPPVGIWVFSGCFLFGQIFPIKLCVSIHEIVLKVATIISLRVCYLPGARLSTVYMLFQISVKTNLWGTCY